MIYMSIAIPKFSSQRPKMTKLKHSTWLNIDLFGAIGENSQTAWTAVSTINIIYSTYSTWPERALCYN